MTASIGPLNIRYCTEEEFCLLRYTLKLTHFVRLFTNVIHISSSRTCFKLFLHIFIISVFNNTFLAYVSNLSIYPICYYSKVWIVYLFAYSYSVLISYELFLALLKDFLKRFSLGFWYRNIWIFAHKLLHCISTNKLFNICTSNS